MNHSTLLRPAFVVGVTGHMDPRASALDESHPERDVRARVRLLLRFLREGADADGGGLLRELAACLPHPQHAPGLDQWPGLGETPLMVLTSLAPGADSLVAEIALDLGLPVRAPLPFARDLYRDASTFVDDPRSPTGPEHERQANYDRLAARIGERNIHAVRLAGEVDLDDAGLHARMAADRDAADAGPRHRRYQAAGEYIASHCDLLLALWDDDCDLGEPESTGSIVRARLRGMTPALLPAANSFTWANRGPAVHVYLPRRKNPKEPVASKLGRMRWLYAGTIPGERPGKSAAASFQVALARMWDVPVARRGESAALWRAYERWQLAGNHFLCRFARNLTAFNDGYRLPGSPALPLCRVLDPGQREYSADVPAPGTLAHDLRTHAPEVFDALAPLAAARRHAADVSGTELRPKSQRALLGMFALVFLFAACLHLFSHWHPRERPVATAWTLAATSEETIGAGEDRSPIHLVFGGACLGCGALSLGLFWWHRRSEVEERDQDCRALSEVLRVQFAWCLAGLHHSAAARYLERQSNELEWIRRALSTLSMPHHRWSEWFRGLDAALQGRLLRWTEANWVNEQAAYHDRRARELKHNLHFLHKLGGVLAMSGVLQVAVLVADAGWPFLGTAGFAHFSTVALVVGTVAGLGLAVAFLVAWRRGIAEARGKGKPWLRAAAKTLAPTAWEVMEWLVPVEPASVYQSPRQRRGAMLVSFGAHLPLAAALGAVTLAAAGVGSERYATWPHVPELATIASGIVLLAGALAVAWTEKNLYSEQAYQFNAMASLFTDAGVRLGECLRAAEAAADPGQRAACIRQAQQLLYDLGVEALHENAEWLILHRARPMEPVMAG